MPSSTAPPLPWSKRHKKVTKAASGGLSFSLSNSFAQPLTTQELVEWSLERGDQALVDEYYNHSLEYTANSGSVDLREAIANLYGPKISADNIIVFPGAQVALQTAARAICHDDMHAITFTPGYQSVVAGPAYAGAGSLTQIPLHPSNGWQIQIPLVQEALRDNTEYIVINEPYNPAGTLMSKSNQDELIHLARKHDTKIYILCDEVYRLLEHNPDADRLPAMADAHEHGLSVVTLSKPWGGCGISIGWIATQDKELLDRISDLQYFGTACPSRASELQAIMCLRESDRILQRNLTIIRQNLVKLSQFIKDYDELFHWIPPTAGAIAAIRFKGPLSSEELGDALAQAGIGIKPNYCFQDSATVDKEMDYFRVGFGEAKMPAALDALRRFVDEHKSEWQQIMNGKS